MNVNVLNKIEEKLIKDKNASKRQLFYAKANDISHRIIVLY